MRRSVLVVAVLAVAVGLVSGCSSAETPEASKAFCRAADNYDNEIERQSRSEVDVDKQIERVAELARTAPPGIEDEAQVFLDAMRQVKDDPSIKDDPDIREAVDDVNRYANQACGVYDRKSGI